MPEYLAPAVFVEETSFRSKSIEGVGTSTAAFVGLTSRGPVTGKSGNAPPLLTSFSDFERMYGGFEDLQFDNGPQTNFLAHAVRNFFDNGGGRIYVARVLGKDANPASSGPVRAGLADAKENVTFIARTAGGTKFSDNTGANFRVRIQLNDQPSTLKNAKLQPFGTLIRFSDDGAGKFAYRFMNESPGNPTVHGTGALPTVDTTSVGVITLSVIVEEPSGSIVEYSGLGLHPKHPRAADLVLGEKPPKASDALTNPVKLVIGDDTGSSKKSNVLWASLFETKVAAANTANALATRQTAVTNAETANNAAKTAADAAQIAAAAPAATQADRDNAVAKQALFTATTKMLDEAKLKLNEVATPPEVSSHFDLTDGSDGSGTAPTISDYKEALDKLSSLEDISIIAAPGGSSFKGDAAAINDALVTAAQKPRAYRIAVLDSPPGQEIADVRELKSKIDSKYAALYYPWVKAPNPMTAIDQTADSEIALPPSGFVCGIYARSDIQRGVWKAPANETISGALRLERDVSFGEQELLNPLGVNCLRYLPNRGYRVWGARTTSSDPEWKYVNIRRYFLYLESSIDRGSQWAVFEPNGERLWANVREMISDFLYNEWVNGALLGTTPKEAFFVRCDRSTMTQNDLDNGRLVCLIGVAAIKPAEFVIFRIGQKTADAKG